MRRHPRFAAFAPRTLLACVAVAACTVSITPRHGRVPMPLETDPSSDAPPPAAVVSLVGNRSCLGTLVAPDRVLTAAHCVVDAAKHSAVRLRAPGGPRDVGIARCRVHPEAYGARVDCGAPVPGPLDASHDLAVLDLVSAVAATDARPIRVALADLPVPVGSLVRIVSAHATELQARALWRVSEQEVAVLLRGVLVARAPEGRPSLSTRPGDSGGPALLARGGAFVLVGALSGGRTAWSPDSWYATTFEPANARWLRLVLPP